MPSWLRSSAVPEGRRYLLVDGVEVLVVPVAILGRRDRRPLRHGRTCGR